MDEEGATERGYEPPVDRLLTHGDPREMRGEWPDYRALGLAEEHVADLIRMATDPDLNWADEDDPKVWAPVHAWRALGQLRAVAAVEPLLELHDELDDSDWLMSELPQVFALIGPAAMPPLVAYLADAQHDVWPRVSAADALAKIGQRHPEARDQCVAALSQMLEKHAENDDILNGRIISGLIDLKAVEAAPVMEQAFAADNVDDTIVGDWEDVQVLLGLLTERLTPPSPYNLMQRIQMREAAKEAARKAATVISRTEIERPLALDDDEEPDEPGATGPAAERRKEAGKAKSKRKMAAQSRRKNKKRT